jgi:predicted glycoside hydrolase/deacetylase ChbG (UPF0249 family)
MSKAILICADDYAISEDTSAVIRALLEEGRINATTCLVEPAIWPAEANRLRSLSERHRGVAVGLHLNLTEPFAAGAAPRPLGWWLRRALVPPAPATVSRTIEAFRSQWQAFIAAFGRPPDFLDGHQHVQLYGPARVALIALAREMGFTGWLRQCETSGPRFLAQRILMDPMSVWLKAEAQRAELRVNPGFGGLRAFARTEDLARLWRADLAGMAQGGLLIVHPGAGGSPPGTAAIDGCRQDEAAALQEGAVSRALAELGLAFAPDARRPDWR